MKLFTGIRQTGNTYRMMEHVEKMLRAEYFKSETDSKNEYNILVVGPNITSAMQTRDQLIDMIGFLEPETKPGQYSKCVTISSGSTKCNINIDKEDNVTLADLKKYDSVIIDDVFQAHPYKDKILIRATVV